MIAAVIAGAGAALALVVLIAWLAHAAIDGTNRAAAADVARAGMAAQLEIAKADVATHQRALEAMARAAATYKDLARAQPPLPGLAPGAHGVDELLAAIDFARTLLPAGAAGGDDRPAGDGGGLPGGAGPVGGPDDPAEPATVPETGRIADVLR